MVNPSDSKVYEVNFDGLIGPTHNFAGLAAGNLASLSSRYHISHPKQAALEGLNKMWLLHSLGLKQAFIPPPPRPDIEALKTFGYEGTEAEIIQKAGRDDFERLLKCGSASSMWTANAATVSPSADTRDGKVHITPANLKTHAHRALEAGQTQKVLKTVFHAECFCVHESLAEEKMSDEGAANHMRLVRQHGDKGINVFVYGKSEGERDGKYPARQTVEASRAVAAGHQLTGTDTFFVRQNPLVIEQGVFHNDVIAVSNEQVLICHEKAFWDADRVLDEIRSRFRETQGIDLCLIVVSEEELPVEEAVRSYLFNSQIVTKPDGDMAVIAPLEAKAGRSKAVFDAIIRATTNPVTEVHYVGLAESMANGGGPACLRLRVVLTEEQFKAVPRPYFLTEESYALIEGWIKSHYRDELKIEELKDPRVYEESVRALNQLAGLLK